MEDVFLIIAIISVFVSVLGEIRYSRGQKNQLNRLCQENGYEEGRVEDEILYCVENNGEHKALIPINDLIKDAR